MEDLVNVRKNEEFEGAALSGGVKGDDRSHRIALKCNPAKP
jgi:hypothetical protein